MIRTSRMADAEFAAFAQTHPVSGGKGDKTVQGGEHSTSQFMSILQNAFAQTFGNNQGILNFLKGKLTNMINNPTGFTPTTKAALTTNAIQQTATDINNAKVAAGNAAAVRGGSTLPSGVQEQIQGQIAAAGANEETSSLNQISLADAQQQQQNYWNAVNGLNSVSAQENPIGYAGGANQSAGALAGLSEANSNAGKVGFFNNFTNSLGAGLGSALTGGSKGGATPGE